jgi:hypothetical protein
MGGQPGKTRLKMPKLQKGSEILGPQIVVTRGEALKTGTGIAFGFASPPELACIFFHMLSPRGFLSSPMRYHLSQPAAAFSCLHVKRRRSHLPLP